MTQAFILDCLRTPRGAGRPGGALSGVPAAGLLAGLLQELAGRASLDTGRVGEAIIGCVTQTGEQTDNVGKEAAPKAD